MQPTSAHYVYHFALYGVRSSGKTCILTALAMPRAAHPKRYTAQWIEQLPSDPLPTGDPKSWTTPNPFHLGWRWLSEQRERMKRGELPDPNPNSADPTKFIFDFSSPDAGQRRVELIDYSGELITATSSQLAGFLRKHMKNCDGLLLLAEVPYPDRDSGPLSRDLDKLKEAFSVLLGERDGGPTQEWPIALLLNKWDRRASLKDHESVNGPKAVATFLSGTPEPPHRSLVDVVENTIGKRNLTLLPVSAFGAHEMWPDGREAPKLNDHMLQSYGLEDGFLWVTQRRDELDVEQYKRSVQRCSWWTFWQPFLGDSPRHCDRDARSQLGIWVRWVRGFSGIRNVLYGYELQRRLPRGKQLRTDTRTALKTVSAKVLVQFLVLIVMFLIGETIRDGVKYRSILASVSNPAADSNGLLNGEKWLGAYYESPPYFHWLSRLTILSRDKANTQLNICQTHRDEMLWKSVSAAKDPFAKRELASAYLAAFPNGLHAPEATMIGAEALQEQYRHENTEYLARLATEVETTIAKGEHPLSEFRDLLQKLLAVPHSNTEGNELFKQRLDLRQKVTAYLGDLLRKDVATKNQENTAHIDVLAKRAEQAKDVDELESLLAIVDRGLPFPDVASAEINEHFASLREDVVLKKDRAEQLARWQRFSDKYDDLMREGKVREAAKHLASSPTHDEALERLQSHFRAHAVSLIEDKVRTLMKTRFWNQARGVIKEVTCDTYIVGGLTAAEIRPLERLGDEVNEAEDRDMYEQVVRYKPQCQDQIGEYLKHAPVKRMESYLAMSSRKGARAEE